MVMCLSMKSSTMTVKRLKSPSFVADHSLLDVVDIVASSGLWTGEKIVATMNDFSSPGYYGRQKQVLSEICNYFCVINFKNLFLVKILIDAFQWACFFSGGHQTQCPLKWRRCSCVQPRKVVNVKLYQMSQSGGWQYTKCSPQNGWLKKLSRQKWAKMPARGLKLLFFG